MKLLLISLILFVVGLPFYKHEMTRYRHCQQDCYSQHEAHRKLLNSKVCTDSELRLKFKMAGTVDCDLAERETRLTEKQCASQMWRSQSEVVQLYNRMFDSYWKLIGFVAVLCLTLVLPFTFGTLYLWIQKMRDRQMMETQERMIDKIVSSTTKPLALPAPKPEKEKSFDVLNFPKTKKRRRRRKKKNGKNERVMLL